MAEEAIWEPVLVKLQIFKTAIESAAMLIRIDDVVSGMKKKKEQKSGKVSTQGPGGPGGEAAETFGDARDG